MEAEKEIACVDAKENGRNPIYSAIVKENVNSLFMSNSILIVTDRSLDIYNKKNICLKDSLSLLQLRSLSYVDQNIIIKYGKEKAKIESKTNSLEILSSILHVIQKLFNETELKSMNFDSFDFPPTNNFRNAAIISLKERLRINNIEFPTQLEQYFSKVLERHEDTAIFKGINENILINLVKVLPLCPDLKTVIFEDIKYDIYKILLENSNCLSKLKCVKIDAKATESFPKFINTLCDTSKFSFNGFGFRNSDLSNDNLAAVCQLTEVHKLTSLSLNNAINNTALPYFYTGFFSPILKTNIISLDLSYTRNINLDQLLPSIKFLTHLSLAYTNHNVSDILSKISSNSLYLLRTLDISGNSCEERNLSSIQFMKPLTRIIANEITWPKKTLLNIFKMVSCRGPIYPIHIHVSDALMSPSDWNSFFDELENVNNFNLVGLEWNGNPMRPELCNFLQGMKEFQTLSVDRVFDDEPDSFFLQYLQQSNIKYLSIRGQESKKIGRGISALIKSLAISKIEEIDISGNAIGDTGISSLRQLQKSKLQRIFFDNNGETSDETLIESLTSCNNLVPPVDDLERLPAAKNFVVRRMNLKISEKKTTNYSLPIDSPYYDAYGYVLPAREHVFPSFFTIEEADEIRKKAFDTNETIQKQNNTENTTRHRRIVNISSLIKTEPISQPPPVSPPPKRRQLIKQKQEEKPPEIQPQKPPKIIEKDNRYFDDSSENDYNTFTVDTMVPIGDDINTMDLMDDEGNVIGELKEPEPVKVIVLEDEKEEEKEKENIEENSAKQRMVKSNEPPQYIKIHKRRGKQVNELSRSEKSSEINDQQFNSRKIKLREDDEMIIPQNNIQTQPLSPSKRKIAAPSLSKHRKQHQNPEEAQKIEPIVVVKKKRRHTKPVEQEVPPPTNEKPKRKRKSHVSSKDDQPTPEFLHDRGSVISKSDRQIEAVISPGAVQPLRRKYRKHGMQSPPKKEESQSLLQSIDIEDISISRKIADNISSVRGSEFMNRERLTKRHEALDSESFGENRSNKKTKRNRKEKINSDENSSEDDEYSRLRKERFSKPILPEELTDSDVPMPYRP
ncbi:Leucine Rich Repeat family protein [Trichomonas vaginalis G3]|uniref:Leucine Rich Repeat family protein n=1 Tax=Trichomonas vaginalis (strain ATCC PRA-98 / G3) TaxID=412133 RepID=A2DVJ0_TRIV3|nr:uncharacterized protein TVAGG3_0275510 [Trichomonas vaginalis G3]EAY15532.1 Leucine Rich Repeat family protein [Trichomonas vaginalis G3]KAI5526178.1 leucine-rich repeat, isoform f-related family [Trichomonas vaginalis G3]|eukprot:XP_001327755.1 hypothetical protein [Trichomonas vaginalis G3]